jgi:hypothetical protein
VGAHQRGELPKDLAQARSRFGAWRERRQGGRRIPQPLWNPAVQLANKHGVSRTATALCLDYYSLPLNVSSLRSQRAPIFASLRLSGEAESGSAGTQPDEE